MNLHTYIQYAAVTSPIVLAIIFLSLTFKSWLDRRTFRSNTVYSAAAQKVFLENMFSEPEDDFDAAMDQVPGLHSIN